MLFRSCVGEGEGESEVTCWPMRESQVLQCAGESRSSASDRVTCASTRKEQSVSETTSTEAVGSQRQERECPLKCSLHDRELKSEGCLARGGRFWSLCISPPSLGVPELAVPAGSSELVRRGGSLSLRSGGSEEGQLKARAMGGGEKGSRAPKKGASLTSLFSGVDQFLVMSR